MMNKANFNHLKASGQTPIRLGAELLSQSGGLKNVWFWRFAPHLFNILKGNFNSKWWWYQPSHQNLYIKDVTKTCHRTLLMLLKQLSNKLNKRHNSTVISLHNSWQHWQCYVKCLRVFPHSRWLSHRKNAFHQDYFFLYPSSSHFHISCVRIMSRWYINGRCFYSLPSIMMQALRFHTYSLNFVYECLCTIPKMVWFFTLLNQN